MWLTAFYSPFIPLGIVWSTLAIISIYWLDKYHIANNRSVPYDLGSDLPEGMTDLLEVFIPLYCLGNLLF